MFTEACANKGHISYLFCKGNKKVGLTEIKYICPEKMNFLKWKSFALLGLPKLHLSRMVWHKICNFI